MTTSPATNSPRSPSPMSFATTNSPQSNLHALPPSSKLITMLLQITTHATINFGSVNLTRNSQYGVISIRSLAPYSPSNTTILSVIKKCDGAKKALSIAALNILLANRDKSLVALSFFFWLSMNHLVAEEKILAELMAMLTSTRGGTAMSLPSVIVPTFFHSISISPS
ncbi:Cytochrome P450 86A22 [Glycine max]|nr:Cytochrome P450 86A22 [Glycine max]